MQFKNWVESERGRAGALAVYLKVPPSFVSKMVSGEKPIPVTHMAAIETFSEGQTTRQEMRPADWQTIWPELSAPTPIPHTLEAQAAAPLTTDAALEADLEKAEQAGLVHLPKKAPVWNGVERRVAAVPRRSVDRLRDIAAAGQGV